MFDSSSTHIIIYILYPILLLTISIGLALNSDMDIQSFFWGSNKTSSFTISLSLISSFLFSPYIYGLVLLKLNDGTIWLFTLLPVVIFILYRKRINGVLTNTGAQTLTQYINSKFGTRIRLTYTFIFLLFNTLLKLLIIFVAGNYILNTVFGIEGYYLLFFLLIISSLYIIIGGVKAERYSELVQLALVFITFLLFWGYVYSSQDVEIIPIIKSNFNFDISTPPLLNSSILGIIAGLPILTFWFMFGDNIVLNRYPKVEKQNITSSYKLKVRIISFVSIVCFFVLVYFYFILSSLHKQNILIEILDSFPELFSKLILISFLSVIIHLFSNMMKSTSAIITFDIFNRLNPGASKIKLLLVARLVTLLLITISFLILPLAKITDIQVGIYILGCLFYFSSMLAAVLVISIFLKKINSSSIFYSMVFGTVTILIKVLGETLLLPDMFLSGVLAPILEINILDFVVFVFFATIVGTLIINQIHGSKEQNLLFKIRYALTHRSLNSKNIIVIALLTVWFLVQSRGM